MRALQLSLVFLAIAILATSSSAQVFKRTWTCTGLHKRCLNLSSGYGPREAKLCAEQREACLKTGEWKSRAFEYKGAERR